MHQRETEMELIQMQNMGSSAEECPAVRIEGPFNPLGSTPLNKHH